MVTDKKVASDFEFGAAVRVTDDAPDEYRCLTIGSVCAVRVIDNDATSVEFSQPEGTVLYLIEGPDGESIEIPGQFLLPLS